MTLFQALWIWIKEALFVSKEKIAPIKAPPQDSEIAISNLPIPGLPYRWYLEFEKDGKRHKVEVAPPISYTGVTVKFAPPSVFDEPVAGYGERESALKRPRDAKGRFTKKNEGKP